MMEREKESDAMEDGVWVCFFLPRGWDSYWLG